MADRDDVIREAMQNAPANERTAGGQPKLSYLNARLREAGHEEVTAEDRDRMWNDGGHDADAPTGADGARDVGGRATDPDASTAPTPEAPAPAAPAATTQPAGQDRNLRDGTLTPADASRVEATTAAPPAGAGGARDDAENLDPRDADQKMRRVKILRANANPQPLYVNGRNWSLDVGRTYRLPMEAVEALRNADVTLEEVEDDEDRDGDDDRDEDPNASPANP